MAVLLLAASGGRAYGQPVTIPPGRDCLETVAGTTWVEFGGNSGIPPIPADFFFPGSQPWEGVIQLRGDPLPGYVGAVNTVVERKDPAVMPGPATVEVELVELNLVSTQPIAVSGPGGGAARVDSFFDITVTLNPNVPSTGYMTITETLAGVGGEFALDAGSGGGVSLYARFNFFEVWPSTAQTTARGTPLTLDSPPLLLETSAPGSYQYAPPEPVCDPLNDFYPVPGEQIQLVLDGGSSGQHVVIAPRQPDGCCLPDGTCVDIDPNDCLILGGVPQGQLCTGTIIACCLPDGSCRNVDQLCCDDLGGYESPHAVACIGDLNGNGIDDACEGAMQACCLPDASCVDTTHMDCVDRGGDPRGPGTDCATTICAPLKWAQPPTFNPQSPNPECFWGWDEASVYQGPQIVADDWLCDSAYPVTDVHWWGSYLGWESPDPPPVGPDLFHIGIWTDVPAGVDEPFSHPGTMIWETLVARADINETPVGCDCYPGLPCETCFRYDYNFSFADPFFQEPACSIYWVSISAVYSAGQPGLNPWGWKTREHFFNDNAVVIWSPTGPVVGSAYVAGAPIEDPIGVSWDMAFTLTTWECPPVDPVTAPDISTHAAQAKNRYLSFVPGNPGRQTALRVTLTASTTFPEAVGSWWWVGPPQEVCENAGEEHGPPCGPALGIPKQTLWSAQLQCDQFCMDWRSLVDVEGNPLDVLHVGDDDIVPGSVYQIEAIDCDCDPTDPMNYSAPLAVGTSRWGDIVDDCAAPCPPGPACGPPDGGVTITDLISAMDKFQNLFCAALKARTDLRGTVVPPAPDRIIDIVDITECINAFTGNAYPFPAPVGCP